MALKWIGGFAVGCFVGFVFGAVLMGVSIFGDSTVTLDECRAANPGYDCDLGWVKGDAW